MEGDIVQMGAYVGAGLACTGMGGAAIGVGHVVGNYISGTQKPFSSSWPNGHNVYWYSVCRSTWNLFVLSSIVVNVCRIRFLLCKDTSQSALCPAKSSTGVCYGREYRSGC